MLREVAGASNRAIKNQLMHPRVFLFARKGQIVGALK